MVRTSRPRFLCATALAALDDPARELATQRLGALDAAMGLSYAKGIRDDSRLAYLHATGQLAASPDVVLSEMAFIQWLSEATDYQAMCEATLPLLATRAKSIHAIRDWAAVWRVTRQYGPELLKCHLVHLAGGVPNLLADATAGAAARGE